MGSLVLGAILAAVASVATTVIAASRRAELETTLQEGRQLHEIELAKLTREHAEEIKENEQLFQQELARLDQQHQRLTQGETLSREDQRIETERRRLKQQTDASDLDIEIAVARMAREHEAEVAKLIYLYFDKLTSDQKIHRELALQALAEFVDVNSMRATLASGHHKTEKIQAPPNGKGSSKGVSDA